MSKVDWSKAPEGATVYAFGKFIRRHNNTAFAEYFNDEAGWTLTMVEYDKLKYKDDYEKRPEKQTEQTKPEKDGNKYHREIIGFCGTKVEVDVYRVLDAFKTESPAIDHAVKKMLCAGIRGHKDYLTDIDNAIESLQEAKLLYLQKQEINKA